MSTPGPSNYIEPPASRPQSAASQWHTPASSPSQLVAGASTPTPTPTPTPAPAPKDSNLDLVSIYTWVTASAKAPSEELQAFISSGNVKLPSPSSAVVPASTRKHTRRSAPVEDGPPKIPRPPNAFMIFRSALIRDVSLGVTKLEKKQQNLSILAGEIWNLMPEEQKKSWREKALARVREHQEQHPQYKYTPKQKPGRGKKAREQEAADAADAAAQPQPRYPAATVTPPESSRQRRRAAAAPYPSPHPHSRSATSTPLQEYPPAWHSLTLPPSTGGPVTTLEGQYYGMGPDGSIAVGPVEMRSFPAPRPHSAHSSPGSTRSLPASFLTHAGQIAPPSVPPMGCLPLPPAPSTSPVPRPFSQPTEAELGAMSLAMPYQPFQLDAGFGGSDALGLGALDARNPTPWDVAGLQGTEWYDEAAIAKEFNEGYAGITDELLGYTPWGPASIAARPTSPLRPDSAATLRSEKAPSPA